MGKRSRSKDNLSEQELELIAKEKEEKFRRQRKVLNHTLQVKHISPLTDNQEKAFHSYFSGQHLLLHGCAGTGKTYIALYLALNDLMQGKFKKLIIVRSAVASRDMGFMPGTLAEKMALYEVPYRELVKDLLQRGDAYDLLKTKNALDFISTSYIRGITLDNAIIILDEAQNLTWHEISSVMTRIGENSKIIVCGDFDQDDLSINFKKNNESGMGNLITVASKMGSFSNIKFEIKDIVRSGFVKEFIIACLNLKSNKS